MLELPHGIPSHDTIGRVLATLKPAAFQACFANWIAQLQSAHVPPEAGEVKQIAIDGKALRRSHDKQKKLGPLFLVSAWSVECGLSLGQLATAEKSNEITAIPALLENLDVKGAIVTIDAAGCQKNIAQQIVDGGGDYVLSLKGNHKNIHRVRSGLAGSLLSACRKYHSTATTASRPSDTMLAMKPCMPAIVGWNRRRPPGSSKAGSKSSKLSSSS